MTTLPEDPSLPDLLTVEEAAALLRIGRTKAYALTREWRDTNGRCGLPVVDLGSVLRVPRRALEQMAGGPLDAAALRPKPRRKSADPVPLSLVDSASTKPKPKRSRRNDAPAAHPRLFG